jgi:hypothetical protein
MKVPRVNANETKPIKVDIREMGAKFVWDMVIPIIVWSRPSMLIRPEIGEVIGVAEPEFVITPCNSLMRFPNTLLSSLTKNH